MTEKPEVVIKISPDGSNVDVDGKNFTGGACKTVIETLTKGVGIVEESKKKPEFYVIEQHHTTLGGST